MFADYLPRHGEARAGSRLEFQVRPARRVDAPAVGLILWEREGGDLGERVAQARRMLVAKPAAEYLVLVAECSEEVAGYARATYSRPSAGGPAGQAPEGWYLAGVVVRPAWRRLGIAAELTRRRLEWLARRAAHAYYFVNAQNRASIDLHAPFGFREVTRDFWFPGVGFQGGSGILYRVELS